MDCLNDQYANVGMHIFHSGFDLLSGSKKIENIQNLVYRICYVVGSDEPHGSHTMANL